MINECRGCDYWTRYTKHYGRCDNPTNAPLKMHQGGFGFMARGAFINFPKNTSFITGEMFVCPLFLRKYRISSCDWGPDPKPKKTVTLPGDHKHGEEFTKLNDDQPDDDADDCDQTDWDEEGEGIKV